MPSWKVPPPHRALLVITDETTPEQIEEALANLTGYARVCRRHRLKDEAESPYEKTHRQIDALITELEERRGRTPERVGA